MNASPSPAASSAARTTVLPGVLAAAAAVVPAYLVHLVLPGLPVLTTAVILGLVAANLPGVSTAVAGPLKPGLSLAARKFMRTGIVLLGLKVSLVDIAGLGWGALLLIVALVGAAFAGTYAICRAFRLPGQEPLLIAAGFSICGVSAIGAVAAARRVRQEDTVVPIALVTLCGTLAIGVLPLLGTLMSLPPETFGIWAGASVHDVGQVVATAQTAGTAALAAAVVVKLARVVLLAPLTAAAGLIRRPDTEGTDEGPGKRPPLLPLFVAGFLALIVLRTTGVVPEGVLEAAALAQEILFAAALFALGAAVRFRALFASGARALSAALASWFLIGALGLGLAVVLSP
ncbi:YeiH family protein [Arthrobacter gengyunqii]|uniref:Sulfate exporter family transporter n=1 Tax=Arthrobacter gengyunqii TaxID=2886940 RepID=A0ABS8GEQ0_9MICC|nr:putative sulfate exporter family transporter [Arthrobacter gengyunqii]